MTYEVRLIVHGWVANEGDSTGVVELSGFDEYNDELHIVDGRVTIYVDAENSDEVLNTWYNYDFDSGDIYDVETGIEHINEISRKQVYPQI